MRATTIALLTFSCLVFPGCDSGEEDKPQFKPSKSLSELKQAKIEVSEEELAAARKNSGFKSAKELAKENAAIFEKGAQEYVKTRMGEYRAVVAELGAHVAEIEKKAAKWASAKDPGAAYEKFSGKYKGRAKELTSTYDTLTGRGAEGGSVQVDLGAAFRTWEDLKNALGPKTAQDERFGTTLATIRERLAAVSKALDAIAKDDGLEADENYEPAKKKKKRKK